MNIDEALKYIKESSKEKFDPSVEVHINLSLDKKSDKTVRVSATLPHGTGKETKVAVLASGKIKGADLELSEADLKKIEKGEIKPKTDFDILVTEPSYMSKVAKIAQILGPAGVMPNPKNGTVTDKVQNAVDAFKKGKQEIRNEQNAPIIHTTIGKLSFPEKNLKENFDELIASLKQNKPAKASPEWIKSVFLCSSMGQSAQVDLA
jgi:large subunit ribosomal protein L1